MDYIIRSVNTSQNNADNITFQAYINRQAFDSSLTVSSDDSKLKFTLRKFTGTGKDFEDFQQILDCSDLTPDNPKEFEIEKSFEPAGFKQKFIVSL